jgi:outer membrane protein assembly factor BamB
MFRFGNTPYSQICQIAVIGLVLAVADAHSLTAQQNWPQFLGPTFDGLADSQHLPTEWSEEKNVTWKIKIHDRGWSSPVIWGNQIWMGTAADDGKKFYAVGVDKTSGKILHDILLFEAENPQFCHDMNSYASPTFALEEGRVYAHFGSYGTAALDSQTGQKIWERTDFACDHWRGPGSSPLLDGDQLYLHFDGFDVQYVVALDKNTGKTIWKVDRDVDYETDNGDVMKAFSTPTMIEVHGQKQLISSTSKAVIAYDPQDGNEIWRVRFQPFSATARPLFVDGLLYVNTGFGKADLLCIDPNGKGDVTDTHIKWQVKQSIGSKPTGVIVDGLIFVASDSGVGACLDAKTGEYYWNERLSGQISSSLLAAGGRVYFFTHEGLAYVYKVSRDPVRVAENQLDDGFMASPAVSGDALFLRTKSHLYRIENKSN